MESKTIKGQAWIEGNSLVQEQILFIPGKSITATNVVVLINDIWADLMSSAGKYKVSPNNSRYFYWEYKQTDTADDDNEITVRIECPKPKEDLFNEPYNPDDYESEWAKYWVGKMKEAVSNYETRAAIQKKEIIFPGTEYVDPGTGELVKVSETRVKNTDVSDITNLLNLF